MITALLLSGIIQGGFLAFLLVRRESNQLPNRILSALILLLMFHLFLICLEVKNLFIGYPHFSRLSWLLPLLYGPLIVLLTQSISDPEFRFRRSHLLLIVPFGIYLGLLMPYFILPGSDKVAYLANKGLVAQADFGWMNSFTNYLHVSFTAFALGIFYQNQPKRTEHFSSRELIDIDWLKEFLWIVLAIMLFSVGTFYAKKHQLAYFSGIYPAHFVLVVILVYWIAFKLLNKKTLVMPTAAGMVAELVTENIEPAPKYAKSALGEGISQDIAARLSALMDNEKPYLENDLTLVDLAVRLGVPRHQLSQVINADFGVNFFEYVNQHRLREFKQQVMQPANSHLSLLGIALDCGFNSKATFNQVFKKLEGTTPSDFVKKSRQNLIS